MKSVAISAFYVASISLFSVGCGSDERISNQEMTGSVGSGWQQQPLEVRSDTDERTSSSPIENGRFALSLQARTSHRLGVVMTDGSVVPMVLPRSDGTVSRELYVHGSGAPFDLGAVNYVDPLDESQIRVRSVSKAADGSSENDDECEDGIELATGNPCVDEQDDVETCDDEGENEQGEYECEDGIDPATGGPCEDGEAEDAVAELPAAAAVPENVPPDGIGSCGEQHEFEGEEDHDHQD